MANQKRVSSDINTDAVQKWVEQRLQNQGVGQKETYAAVKTIAERIRQAKQDTGFRVDPYQCLLVAEAHTAASKVTLVEVPPGQGKTIAMLLLALHELSCKPGKQVLIMPSSKAL